jgi:hypothetical protein
LCQDHLDALGDDGNQLVVVVVEQEEDLARAAGGVRPG